MAKKEIFNTLDWCAERDGPMKVFTAEETRRRFPGYVPPDPEIYGPLKVDEIKLEPVQSSIGGIQKRDTLTVLGPGDPSRKLIGFTVQEHVGIGVFSNSLSTRWKVTRGPPPPVPFLYSPPENQLEELPRRKF